jgi:hypothetical protein
VLLDLLKRKEGWWNELSPMDVQRGNIGGGGGLPATEMETVRRQWTRDHALKGRGGGGSGRSWLVEMIVGGWATPVRAANGA